MTIDHDHDHPEGLAHDLRVLSRRRMLGMVARGAAGLSLIPVLAHCNDGDGATVDAGNNRVDAAPGSCSTIPTETAGPYPGDGTNGANSPRAPTHPATGYVSFTERVRAPS